MNSELSDEQWKIIAPLLPPRRKGRGRPRADDRHTLRGILYVLRTGCRWQDLPRGYPHPSTCWRRLRRWQESGVWECIRQALLQTLDAEGRLVWSQAFLDGTFVPAKKGAKR
jgi:transposase